MSQKLNEINKKILIIDEKKLKQEKKINELAEQYNEEINKLEKLNFEQNNIYEKQYEEIKTLRNQLLTNNNNKLFIFFDIEYAYSMYDRIFWILKFKTNNNIGLVILYDHDYIFYNIIEKYKTMSEKYIITTSENKYTFNINYTHNIRDTIKIIDNVFKYSELNSAQIQTSYLDVQCLYDYIYNIYPIYQLPEIPNDLIIESKKFGLLLKLSKNNLDDEFEYFCDNCEIDNFIDDTIYFFLDDVIINNKEIKFIESPCLCSDCYKTFL